MGQQCSFCAHEAAAAWQCVFAAFKAAARSQCPSASCHDGVAIRFYDRTAQIGKEGDFRISSAGRDSAAQATPLQRSQRLCKESAQTIYKEAPGLKAGLLECSACLSISHTLLERPCVLIFKYLQHVICERAVQK